MGKNNTKKNTKKPTDKNKKEKNIMVPIIAGISAVTAVIILFATVGADLIRKNDLKKQIETYEQKYIISKSETDLINLVYFLENSDGETEDLRLKYVPELLNVITENGIQKSEMKDYYKEFPNSTPKDVIILFRLSDLLTFEKFDDFEKELTEYYPEMVNPDRELLSGIITNEYESQKNVEILKKSILAFSKIAKDGDENLLFSCLEQIVKMETAANEADKDAVTANNEILKSLTDDGENIRLTVSTGMSKEKVCFNILKGDFTSD